MRKNMIYVRKAVITVFTLLVVVLTLGLTSCTSEYYYDDSEKEKVKEAMLIELNQRLETDLTIINYEPAIKRTTSYIPLPMQEPNKDDSSTFKLTLSDPNDVIFDARLSSEYVRPNWDGTIDWIPSIIQESYFSLVYKKVDYKVNLSIDEKILEYAKEVLNNYNLTFSISDESDTYIDKQTNLSSVNHKLIILYAIHADNSTKMIDDTTYICNAPKGSIEVHETTFDINIEKIECKEIYERRSKYVRL